MLFSSFQRGRESVSGGQLAHLRHYIGLCTASSATRARCEDIIAQHMVDEALLAAHFVASDFRGVHEP